MRTPTPRPLVCSGANIAGPNPRITSSFSVRELASEGVMRPLPSYWTVQARPPSGITWPSSLSASWPSASSTSSSPPSPGSASAAVSAAATSLAVWAMCSSASSSSMPSRSIVVIACPACSQCSRRADWAYSCALATATPAAAARATMVRSSSSLNGVPSSFSERYSWPNTWSRTRTEAPRKEPIDGWWAGQPLKAGCAVRSSSRSAPVSGIWPSTPWACGGCAIIRAIAVGTPV